MLTGSTDCKLEGLERYVLRLERSLYGLKKSFVVSMTFSPTLGDGEQETNNMYCIRLYKERCFPEKARSLWPVFCVINHNVEITRLEALIRVHLSLLFNSQVHKKQEHEQHFHLSRRP